MRISLAMLLAILATLTLGEPAQAQLDRCDDCNIMWDSEGNEILFAFCELGGGGPFIDCFQQHPLVCSFGGLCYPEQQVAFVVGDVTTVLLRDCDGSAILRTFVAAHARAHGEAPPWTDATVAAPMPDPTQGLTGR